MSLRGSQFVDATKAPATRVRGSTFASKPRQTTPIVTGSRQADSVSTKDYVQVRGGYVSKAEFLKLSLQDQRRLREVGVEQFNIEKQAKFAADFVQTKDGLISKEEYNKLTPEQQRRIKEIGVDAFNKEQAAQFEQFKATHVEIKDGWMAKADYDKLSAADQSRIKAIGVEAFNTEKQTQLAAVNKKLEPYYLSAHNEWWESANYAGAKLSPEDNFRMQWSLNYVMTNNRQPTKAEVDKAVADQKKEEYSSGYNLTKAIVDGVISEPELKSVGYDTSGLSQLVSDYKAVQQTMNTLTGYHVPATSNIWVDLAGNEIKPENVSTADIIAGKVKLVQQEQPEGYNVTQATAEGKVTTSQLVNAGFIENSPTAIQRFDQDVKDYKQNLVTLETIKRHNDDPVAAYMAAAINDNDLRVLGYSDKDVNEVKVTAETLKAMKDYYVPATTKTRWGYWLPEPKPVDYKIPEGYRYIDAYNDGKVTIGQLQTANFLPKPNEPDAAHAVAEFKKVAAEAKTQADHMKRVEALQAKIDDPKYVSYDEKGNPVYSLESIYRDKPIKAGEIVLLFGAQPGDEKVYVTVGKKQMTLAEYKKQALLTASATAAKQRQKQIVHEYRHGPQMAWNIARTYLDYTVPFHATQRHWSQMGKGGPLFFGHGPSLPGPVHQGISVVGDLLWFVPVIGWAYKGARSANVARVGLTSARAARVTGALKESFGLGVTMSKPAGMTDEAWKAMNLASKFRKYATLQGPNFGEFWRQVAWPAYTLESVGKVAAKGVTTAKSGLFNVEVQGKLLGDVFDPKTGHLVQAAKAGDKKRGVYVAVMDWKNKRVMISEDGVNKWMRESGKKYVSGMGGQIDPAGDLGRVAGKPGISLEGAAYGQVLSETGVKIKNIRNIGVWHGIPNPFRTKGAYTFIADAETTRINRYFHTPKGKRPELSWAGWWNGKTDLYTTPQWVEILSGIADAYPQLRWNKAKLHIHSLTPKELLASGARDPDWAKRLLTGLSTGEVAHTTSPFAALAEIAGGGTVATGRQAGREAVQTSRGLVGRAKQLYGPLETLLSPITGKLPEATVFNAHNVLRVPRKFFKSDKQAFDFQGKITKMLMQSKEPVIGIELPDHWLFIRRTELMNKGGFGAAHVTSEAGSFYSGTMAKINASKALRERGLFAGSDPFVIFAQKGGKRPAIYITTPEFAAKHFGDTRKFYRAGIELEQSTGTRKVFLPKPKQVLHTRIGYTGERIDILLPEKLTRKQRAELLKSGLVEQAKQLYEPSIWLEPKTKMPTPTVKGKAVKAYKGLADDEVKTLSEWLDGIDRRMGENLRAISRDPAGAAAALRRQWSDVEYHRARISNPTGNQLRVDVETMRQRPNEDVRQFLNRARADTERANRQFVSRVNQQASRIVRNVEESRQVSYTGRPVVVPRTGLPARPVAGRVGVTRTGTTGRAAVTRKGVTSRTAIGRFSRTHRAYIPRTGIPERGRGLLILPKSKTDKRPIKTYPPGAVGWRQGQLRKDVYWVMYKEKGKAGEGSKVVLKYHGQAPPEGVKIVSGPRSAYESFGRTPGYIPRKMKGALGIMDVRSLAHGKELKYKRILERGRKGRPTTTKTRK